MTLLENTLTWMSTILKLVKALSKKITEKYYHAKRIMEEHQSWTNQVQESIFKRPALPILMTLSFKTYNQEYLQCVSLGKRYPTIQ